MIEEIVKIHDKFSIEMKLGFLARKKKKVSDFACNTWIFIPNSLDINSATYLKSDFYRDIKSNIRLITPVFLLRDIANRNIAPFDQLEYSFYRLASSPTRTNSAAYEYQVRMFLSILKSALRNEIDHITTNNIPRDIHFLIGEYVKSVNEAARNFRSLRRIINAPTVSKEMLNFYLFGDEFMSNLIEQHTFRLLSQVEQSDVEENSFRQLKELIQQEIAYKKLNNFPVVEKDSHDQNSELVFRLGLLKKYAENELFLTADKKKDGTIAEQVYFSIAAGISMIFATVIAFSFQRHYGNYTMPLFVALVVSYMLKDRIKDLSRSYFAHRLGKRYFDIKTRIKLNGQEIGWSKEAMDFIPAQKIPPEVIRTRSRSPILEAGSRGDMEKTILYRKLVRLKRKALDGISQFSTAGMNEIIRLNFSGFIAKMDNPHVPLYVLDEDEKHGVIKGEKIYYINLVIQLKSENQLEYHHYRIALNRKGIRGIENRDSISVR